LKNFNFKIDHHLKFLSISLDGAKGVQKPIEQHPQEPEPEQQPQEPEQHPQEPEPPVKQPPTAPPPVKQPPTRRPAVKRPPKRVYRPVVKTPPRKIPTQVLVQSHPPIKESRWQPSVVRTPSVVSVRQWHYQEPPRRVQTFWQGGDGQVQEQIPEQFQEQRQVQQQEYFDQVQEPITQQVYVSKGAGLRKRYWTGNARGIIRKNFNIIF